MDFKDWFYLSVLVLLAFVLKCLFPLSAGGLVNPDGWYYVGNAVRGVEVNGFDWLASFALSHGLLLWVPIFFGVCSVVVMFFLLKTFFSSKISFLGACFFFLNYEIFIRTSYGFFDSDGLILFCWCLALLAFYNDLLFFSILPLFILWFFWPGGLFLGVVIFFMYVLMNVKRYYWLYFFGFILLAIGCLVFYFWDSLFLIAELNSMLGSVLFYLSLGIVSFGIVVVKRFDDWFNSVFFGCIFFLSLTCLMHRFYYLAVPFLAIMFCYVLFHYENKLAFIFIISLIFSYFLYVDIYYDYGFDYGADDLRVISGLPAGSVFNVWYRGNVIYGANKDLVVGSKGSVQLSDLYLASCDPSYLKGFDYVILWYDDFDWVRKFAKVNGAFIEDCAIINNLDRYELLYVSKDMFILKSESFI